MVPELQASPGQVRKRGAAYNSGTIAPIRLHALGGRIPFEYPSKWCAFRKFENQKVLKIQNDWNDRNDQNYPVDHF